MTHKNIYTKFLIEYDKANVTSSYPSLTEYEGAVILDKAYYALIAQKVTGNNVRRSYLESDLKAISDLAPLVKEYTSTIETNQPGVPAPNVFKKELPEDFLYYVSSLFSFDVSCVYFPATFPLLFGKMPMDRLSTRPTPIKLVSHDMAQGFFSTPYNLPWVKIPVCFIESGDESKYMAYVVYDPIPGVLNGQTYRLVYIKKPVTFVNKIDSTEFELNETAAEELVSLAVSFALENVESPRLNTKLNMRGLEA